jgi:hypothetical protein
MNVFLCTAEIGQIILGSNLLTNDVQTEFVSKNFEHTWLILNLLKSEHFVKVVSVQDSMATMKSRGGDAISVNVICPVILQMLLVQLTLKSSSKTAIVSAD